MGAKAPTTGPAGFSIRTLPANCLQALFAQITMSGGDDRARGEGKTREVAHREFHVYCVARRRGVMHHRSMCVLSFRLLLSSALLVTACCAGSLHAATKAEMAKLTGESDLGGFIAGG